MQLKIESKLDNNKAVLGYKSTPDRPYQTPKYIINSDKADEFVTKYNKQDSHLKKDFTLSTVLGGLLGLGLSIFQKENKVLKSAISTPAGIGLGFFSTSVIAYEKNNKLMDKYHVTKY